MLRLIQLHTFPPIGFRAQFSVRERVDAHLVPTGHHPADKVGMLGDLLSEDEEGAGNVEAVEHVEDPGGVVARPVIEGQRDGARRDDPAGCRQIAGVAHRSAAGDGRRYVPLLSDGIAVPFP